MIKWLLEDTKRYGPKTHGYGQRLTLDFNSRFGKEKTCPALTRLATKLKKNGQVTGQSFTPYECAVTPPAQIDGRAGLLSPPASPEKSKEVFVEFLDECGVIISTGDELWYELRCHICGRNASANGAFFKGWEGVLRHLVKTHDDLDNTEEEDDIDFVLRKCTLRQVTLTEVEEIEQGRHMVDKIRKEDEYAAQLVRKSGIAAGLQQRDQQEAHSDDLMNDIIISDGLDLDHFECSVCTSPCQVDDVPELCHLCGWVLCTICDSRGEEFFENGPVHKCTQGNTMETNSTTSSSTPSPSVLGRCKNKFAAMELAPILELLDDYCPCTLSGHACKALICNKKEICLVSFSMQFAVNTVANNVSKRRISMVSIALTRTMRCCPLAQRQWNLANAPVHQWSANICTRTRSSKDTASLFPCIMSVSASSTEKGLRGGLNRFIQWSSRVSRINFHAFGD